MNTYYANDVLKIELGCIFSDLNVWLLRDVHIMAEHILSQTNVETSLTSVKATFPLKSLIDTERTPENELLFVKECMRTVVEMTVLSYYWAAKIQYVAMNEDELDNHEPSEAESTAMQVLLPMINRYCELAVALMTLVGPSTNPYVSS